MINTFRCHTDLAWFEDNMMLLNNVPWASNVNITGMLINGRHTLINSTCARIPYSYYHEDPAVITTGASWRSSFFDIFIWQLSYTHNLILYNHKQTQQGKHRHAHSNTTVWPHPTPTLLDTEQSGRKQALVPEEHGLLFLQTSLMETINWGRNSGL